MNKGIIFDFNGTLYWDTQLHCDAWREYSKMLRGYEFNDEEMFKQVFGHTNEEIIEYAISKKPTKEMVDKIAKEKEELYRKRCKMSPETFKLADGAVELLDYLKEKNVPIAIATMSEWDNVEFYIKEFQLEKWFDLDKIVYSDGTIPGKPAPDIFQIAVKRLNLEPKDCTVIEDAVSGIEAANNANIGYVVAIASLKPVEYYKNMKVNKIIKNFYELLDYYKKPSNY